ncbi:SNF2-related protein [Caulobacter sp.]|uniref:SNF2-related protein n=1 Tax=Caulobacter sp. TaxID=78 RepID=UPI001B2A401B|nr:SNF2-related protein [Caulobacter sp.]MBO9545632.1 DEAD/DEAH box helicase [Caulobacter sp.]
MTVAASITDYQAKLIAFDLVRRRPPDSSERLAVAVAGAQVDMNPHQVDAALFAFASPLSKGALLADEVGLGKTIEAGLVISQRWAENRRRILIIAPSNLRKQWHQELAEKFFIPSAILEAKSYNAAAKAGNCRPFDRTDSVVICSYQFARNKASDVEATPWDLVIVDEAHRLRNVYKPSNVIANTLKRALADRHKLLLTATPLQNSLLELFGLVSFIDEHSFGDIKSFREQFSNLSQERTFEVLRDRLKPICHRTLRRQVTAYVPYTARHAILQSFSPDAAEDRLYDLVTQYLQRENLQALPASQRALMTLVLRKLLASSTFAIAGALTSIANRLQERLDQSQMGEGFLDELEHDYEALDETAEEWEAGNEPEEQLTAADRKALASEICELKEFAALASSIEQNAKGRALLKALDVGFAKARELGAAEKAIIFTESKRTQAYLLRLLGDSPHAAGIVLFNGTNTDPGSKAIYDAWLEQNKDSDRVTGSRTADMRSALVDYFRGPGRIMIATEAGAEGINLQFCSMIVNYDLPWNPQRVEQRIGRCHRYGQKHDVVVVNFLNERNQADQRVYELLSEKFQLFEGVFGASDEVLGAIESGVDFEKRIAGIYQQCRQPNDIKAAFDQLQQDLSLEINEAMTSARRKLLENFDDEVREKLKLRNADTNVYLGHFERQLMRLTRHELAGDAEFLDSSSFRLDEAPVWAGRVPTGLYELPRRSGEAHFFRVTHPLGEAIIHRARTRDLPVAELILDYASHEGRISVLEPLVGRSGWLHAIQLSVASLEHGEDHILLTGITDDGAALETDALNRLMTLPGSVGRLARVPTPIELRFDDGLSRQRDDVRRTISERNARYFEEEATKLDAWADDLKVGLEREIREIDRQIKEARRAATAALTLDEKLAGQKAVKALEAERNTKRRSLFDAQDRIDFQREDLIASIEGKLEQQVSETELFTVRWSVR